MSMDRTVPSPAIIMRRSMLIVIGVFLPCSVHAAALSPWVQAVIDLSERGVTVAQNIEETGSCSPETSIAAIGNNRDTVLQNARISVLRARERELLMERTACFRSDRFLLEQQLQKVLILLQEKTGVQNQSDSCRYNALAVLRTVYDFLAAAYVSFVEGSDDPTYADDLLQRRYIFERTDFQNTEMSDGMRDPSRDREPLCPFTSDYAPHSVGYIPAAFMPTTENREDVRSFGCDATVLSERVLPALRSVNPADQPAGLIAEVESTIAFQRKTDAFARPLHQSVNDALSTIDAFIDVIRSPRATQDANSNDDPVYRPSPSLRAPLEHAVRSGCLRPLIDKPNFGSYTDLESILQSYPALFDPNSMRAMTIGSFTLPRYFPDSALVLPTWLLFRPTGDSSVTTIQRFADKKRRFGERRPLPTSLLGDAGGIETQLSYLQNTIYIPNDLRGIAGEMEWEAAVAEALHRDAIERTSGASSSLRTAVATLSEAVGTYLPDTYIPQFVYFMLRNCLGGYCQQTLRTVAKRTFNPYCHPYLSGKYVEEDAAKRCFCDDAVKESWSEFDKYCSDTLSPDEIAQYQRLPAKEVPACTESEIERK